MVLAVEVAGIRVPANTSPTMARWEDCIKSRRPAPAGCYGTSLSPSPVAGELLGRVQAGGRLLSLKDVEGIPALTGKLGAAG